MKCITMTHQDDILFHMNIQHNIQHLTSNVQNYSIVSVVHYFLRANSGLGKEMATYASAKGAKLYMICRSKDRAEQARQEIVSKTANENVKVILVR